MPGIIPTGTSRAFGLYFQGVNVTSRVPAESVRVTEVAGESTAVLEFDYENVNPAGHSLAFMATPSHTLRLADLTNNRTLFLGVLVNTRRVHGAGPFVTVHCTAISGDSWLDRKVLPKWVSKRPNGSPMTSDREMVQNVITLGADGYFDAINTYVASTNTNMPVVKVDQGGSLRDILSAIAEAAATAAEPTARRFYVDFDSHLHYFKGSEGTTAPFRIGDANYTSEVKATSGLVSLWAMRESTGTTLHDAQGYANATLIGGYTQNVTGLVPNEPAVKAVTFNGSTGYATASGANLHQADGPWSIELWFKRATFGTAQSMVSAGANDYDVSFDSSNRIAIFKEAAGVNFTTTATYTDANRHHLVVVRPAGGPTVVYVDGTSKAGTTTAKTFASAVGAVNIGRRRSVADRYYSGTLQNVAIYSTELSAATVLAHYNDGMTIVPDYIEFETDVNNAGYRVYVKGGTKAGTGWVEPTPKNAAYSQTFLLDAPQSTTASLKEAIGRGFLKREADETYGGRAVITMAASTWRAGQTVTIDDAGLGIDGSVAAISQTYEIKQLETSPNMGSGVVTYDIYFGALPWSGTFSVQKKRRRGSSGGYTGSN